MQRALLLDCQILLIWKSTTKFISKFFQIAQTVLVFQTFL